MEPPRRLAADLPPPRRPFTAEMPAAKEESTHMISGAGEIPLPDRLRTPLKVCEAKVGVVSPFDLLRGCLTVPSKLVLPAAADGKFAMSGPGHPERKASCVHGSASEEVLATIFTENFSMGSKDFLEAAKLLAVRFIEGFQPTPAPPKPDMNSSGRAVSSVGTSLFRHSDLNKSTYQYQSLRHHRPTSRGAWNLLFRRWTHTSPTMTENELLLWQQALEKQQLQVLADKVMLDTVRVSLHGSWDNWGKVHGRAAPKGFFGAIRVHVGQKFTQSPWPGIKGTVFYGSIFCLMMVSLKPGELQNLPRIQWEALKSWARRKANLDTDEVNKPVPAPASPVIVVLGGSVPLYRSRILDGIIWPCSPTPTPTPKQEVQKKGGN